MTLGNFFSTVSILQSRYPLVSEAVYPLTDQSNFCMIQTNKTQGPKVFVKSHHCYQ